jgi:predicted nucleic acid-binding protein
MVVIDASATLEVLLMTGIGHAAIETLLHAEESLHAPHLLDIEFAHVLRRLVQGRAIEPSIAQQALRDLSELRLVRHSHTTLLPRIWELRSSHSAYDASYVALAEFLDLPLYTCDAKLARSHGHEAKIVLLTGN